MKYLLQIFVAMSTSLGLQAAESPDPLAWPEAKFQVQVSEEGKKLDEVQAKQGKRYEKILGELSERYQKNGDLEGVLAVKAEVKRFAEAGSLSKADISERPELRAVQRAAWEALNKVEAERKKVELRLLQQYGRTLVALKKKLTQAGEIEAAVRARKRADELKARIGALREGADSQLKWSPPLEQNFDLSDLDSLAKHWRWKAGFKAAADGLRADRGPANELESRFKMKGDFEVRLKFHFGRAQFSNTGGTWMVVCGQRLNITNGWRGFDADIRVRRVGSKLFFNNSGKTSEIPIPDGKLYEPTSFLLWWRSRSCHFKELSVSAKSVLRD